MYQFETFILCRWSNRPAQRKPAAVHDYNQRMRGVNRMDQMVAYYSFGRKSIKWWRKVFFWMVEVMVNNGHILYTRHTSSQRKLPMVSSAVSWQFLCVKTCQLAQPPLITAMTTRWRGYEVSISLTKCKRKDCRVCSQRGAGGERHLTNTICGTCSDHPPSYIEGCFKKYHTRLSL